MRPFRSPVPAAAVLVLAAMFAAPAPAQFERDPQRDDPLHRYRETRYGANLDEWALRLKDPSPEIRLEAVKSLVQSRDPKGAPLLMGAVADPDARVAIRAVAALGEIRATEATEFLAERLVHKGTHDRLRHEILGALSRIGDSRALQPLLDFVEQTNDPALRGTAIFALGEIGDTTIREPLEDIAERETDPKLERLAREALTKISGRRFEPTPRPTGVPDPLLRPLEP